MVQPNLDVIDANLVTVNVNTINPNGVAAGADSQPVALSTEDKAAVTGLADALDTINTALASALLVYGGLTPDDAAFGNNNNLGVLSAVSSNTDLTLTSGRAQPLTVTTDGDLKVTLAGEDVTIAGTVTVDGTVNAVPWDGSDSLIFEAGSDAISNSAMRMPTAGSLLLFNGTSFDRARGTVGDGLLVNLGANNDVTVTGTVAVSAASLPLPTGASTSAKQDTIIAAIDTLETIFTDVIGFETTANLTSAATYSSGLLSLSPPYSQVLTNILSDRTGTLNIYWYSDSGGTDLVRTLTVAYTAGDGFLSFGAPAFTKYVKYEFTNSAGASTTDFYFTTKFLTKPVNSQIATLNAPLANGMVGMVTRSVLTGVTTAGGGSFVNVKVNPSGTLETNATLAAGTALVGKVGIDQATANANEVVTKTGSTTAVTGTVAVSGTFWQATQPVSLASGSVSSGAFASGALASGSIAAGAIATGATSIAANEDDASANLDTGIKVMARRTATPANTSGTDLDYEMIQMNAGRVWTSTLLTDGTTTAGVIVGTTALKTDASSIAGTATVTAGVNGLQAIGGAAAHAASISGNPVRTGLRALTADYTAVTTGQTADAISSPTGKQIVIQNCLPNLLTTYAAPAAGLVSTAAVNVAAAPGAGLRIFVTGWSATNSHQTIGSEVRLVTDAATGNTTLRRAWAQFAGGGFAETFNPPIPCTVNKTLDIAEVTATATAGILVNVTYYIAAE